MNQMLAAAVPRYRKAATQSGLSVGPAAGPVAEIELLLDGRTVEVLEEEPWRFGCELGLGLEPHELTQVEVFAPRNGAALPPCCLRIHHGPLSLVKIT